MIEKIRKLLPTSSIQTLASWRLESLIPQKMLYRDAALQQIDFVEKQLAPLLSCEPMVIGTRRSKSIELPVFILSTADICFVLRNNFYNWKVSCISARPITEDLSPWMNMQSQLLHPVYFEGFPKKLVFDPWASDRCEWSAKVFSDEQLLGLITSCRDYFAARCRGLSEIDLALDTRTGLLQGQNVRVIEAHKSWYVMFQAYGKPLGLMWHYTATDPGTAEHMAVRRMRPRKPTDRPVSWHVTITHDGHIVQMVPFNRSAWHCAKGQIEGHPINWTTIGIELEGHGEVFPEAQVQAACVLARVLAKAYGIPRERAMLEHSAYDPKRRQDPGPIWMREHAPRVLEYAYDSVVDFAYRRLRPLAPEEHPSMEIVPREQPADQIEKAAQALYETCYRACFGETAPSWNTLDEKSKRGWTNLATCLTNL